ncbi:insulin-like growth factor-binding protein 3 [Anolis sagrei]|uniref:insulin-like growth factor-binding protein 3 n=1 Tax=Anolis sagrei TaxID=38937 RepID=UPI003521657C
MGWRFCLLLWAVAALQSGLAGPVVRCEPCGPGALERCKPLTPECLEPVREPGCGCCWTCALREGQPCGVYTERCGAGLRCRPPSQEPKPLQALLDGKGLCANVSGEAARGGGDRGASPSSSSSSSTLRELLLSVAHAPGNSSDSDEDQNISGMATQPVPNTHRLLESRSHGHHTKIDIIRKEHAKNTQRYKYDSQSTDTLNFSSESKQDIEYGPCRREMEDTLNNLNILNVLSPGGLHIPNCDKRGFYKKKQCRPSRGRKRGYCWCVDKYGQPLPGYDGKGKEDIHCYSFESK